MVTDPPHDPIAAPDASARPASHDWAASSLRLTAALAVLAKVLGVIVVPGMRGAFAGSAVDQASLASAVLGYVLTGLLVALIGVASFELAKAQRIPAGSRFPVVALAGLVVALASPAVVDRLPRAIAAALAVLTCIITTLAGASAALVARTRAVGVVLVTLALTALLRLVAWETAVAASENASLSTFHVAQALSTIAVVLHAGALLLAGAWLGSRSGWRGRILANLAIVLAFALTWVAGRQADAPSTFELVLRSSLGSAAGVPTPFVIGPVAVFLLPAGLLLACVALVQRRRPETVLAATALALVSHGSYDVPLQALGAIVAAQWALLARDGATTTSG